VAASLCSSMIFFFKLPLYFWRLLFVLSSIAFMTAAWFRFRDSITNFQVPIVPEKLSKYLSWSYIYKHKLALMQVALSSSVSQVTYLIPFVFLNSLMPIISDITFEEMILFNNLLLFFDMIIIPLVGRVITSYSSQIVILFSSFIMLVSIPTLLYFLPSASLFYVFFVRIWIVFWGVVFLCPQNIYYHKLFPGKEKYLLVGMISSLMSGIIGKFSTPFSLYLWYKTQDMSLIVIYFGVIIGLNFLCHISIFPQLKE
jgi:hypothetical protein